MFKEKDIKNSLFDADNNKLKINTKDKVFIESFGDMKKEKYYDSNEKIYRKPIVATDYFIATSIDSSIYYEDEFCVANNVYLYEERIKDIDNHKGKFIASGYFDRFNEKYTKLGAVYSNNGIGGAICPCLNINVDRLKSKIDILTVYENNENICGKNILIYNLCYPQSKVDDETNKKLNDLYHKNLLKKTGKVYHGPVYTTNIEENYEYEFENNKYVRCLITIAYEQGEYYNDGTTRKLGVFWFKVEPILWEVLNWEDLDWENFKKNKDKVLILKSIKALFKMGNGQDIRDLKIPIEDLIVEDNKIIAKIYTEENSKRLINGKISELLWQNSQIRAYLNGYNLEQEILNGNGDKTYLPITNYNYLGKGFIDEIIN